jgi:VanZ family protein
MLGLQDMALTPTLAFRLACALTALGWAGFVFYESVGSPGSAAIPHLTNTEAYYGHAAVYAVLAFFAVTISLSRRAAVLLAIVVACAALGLTIELYQEMLPRRTATVGDALANTVGATIGGVAAWLLVPVWQAALSKLRAAPALEN